MSRASDPFCAQRGFTLIEVMVSSAVLALVAVGVAATVAQSPRLTASARDEMAARSAMRGVLARVTAHTFSDVAFTFHGTGFDVPGLPPVEGDLDGLPGSIFFEEGPDGIDGIYTVTVVVAWKSVAGNRTLRGVHYIANIRGDTNPPVPYGDGEQTGDPTGEGEAQ